MRRFPQTHHGADAPNTTLGPRFREDDESAFRRETTLGPRLRGDAEPAFRSNFARLLVGLALSGGIKNKINLGPGLRREAESARQSRFLRMLGVALLGGLGSCGFHLRGQAEYAFSTLFVNSPAAIPLTVELKRSLEGIGSAQLVAAADKAQVVLDLNSVEDNKQILSLSSGGKVREFLLTKRVLFRVHDSDGNDWLPTAEVLVRRSYTYTDTEALAKEAQEQRLWREMQTDAVQQIVRRLQTARKPVA